MLNQVAELSPLLQLRRTMGGLPGFALAALVMVVFYGRFRSIPLENINWDEFLYLAKVFQYERGELSTAFQTLHVHLFGWLTTVSGDEVDQVIAGRRAMFAVQLLGAGWLWLLGRWLLGPTGAWFSVLAGASFSYVMVHGESFRADPLITGLFLTAAAVLVIPAPSVMGIATAALALAVAAVISIKAVLFLLPAFALLLAAARWRHSSTPLVWQILFAGGFFAVAYALVLFAHGAALPIAPATTVADRAISTGAAFSEATRIFALHTFKATLLRDWAFWLLLAAGAALAGRRLLSGAAPERKFAAAVVLILLLPLLTLPFYRNAFAYFYVCLVPGAALACGYFVHSIEARFRERPTLAALIIGLLTLPMLWQAQNTAFASFEDATTAQREVLAAVREVFPEPVPYLDRCSMVASYPKVGMFMSTLVTSAYRARGEPVMRELLANQQPVFLLANVGALDLSRPESAIRSRENRLLAADYLYLQDNYIRHWGPIWVAGKEIPLPAREEQRIEIPVTGPYTVETEGRVELDGQPVEAGAVVHLAAGMHRVRSGDAAKLLTLRYGAHLARPRRPPPSEPLFTGFRLARR